MISLTKLILKKILNIYPKWVCKQEYNKQSFNRVNERPVEYAFVFRCLAKIYPKCVLDVGTGTTSLPHLMRTCRFIVTATDNIHANWESGIINRHYHVIDDDITGTRLSKKFDLISCVSVLEHIDEADKAVSNMLRLLKNNGYLILTMPYNENTYINNVYDLDGSSYGRDCQYITQSFSRKEIDNWAQTWNLEILDQEYWNFWTGKYWTVGSQIIPPKKVKRNDNHQLSCILFKRRD